jgi:type II/III secretion system protein
MMGYLPMWWVARRVLPTDNTARDQVVQYKDVGTRLRVLPTISTDGQVMLRAIQEINAATTETAFDAPIISTRSVETRLLINDRQTVVLGGLFDRQREATLGGVPVPVHHAAGDPERRGGGRGDGADQEEGGGGEAVSGRVLGAHTKREGLSLCHLLLFTTSDPDQTRSGRIDHGHHA